MPVCLLCTEQLVAQEKLFPEMSNEWGEKMLDKFRYRQACMCQQISYLHWMEDIMRCWHFHL
ncbi:hypothetical protein ACRYJJ_00500 [Cylindrospermopsis raciborskii G7]|uniref:hypothetical protein n=1 Tax=Cylindrospermopsis raciborskii TaxID=77022 RepID=UPI003EC078A8